MIAAALRPTLARVFAECLPADFATSIVYLPVEEPRWWSAVQPGALVVLDPTLFSGDAVSLAMAGSTFAAVGARVAFYTSFSSESMHAVASASVLLPVELWITGIDDRAQEFGRRVQRLAAHGLVAEVLPRLLVDDEHLPHAIRAGVIALFTTPERFFDAGDLARAAMTSRRSLDRHLADSGLGTARRLIVAAKMLHGMVRFGGSGASRSSRSVADSLGYSDPEVFARQFSDVFGVRPAARATLGSERVVSSLLAYVRSSGSSCSETSVGNAMTVSHVAAG